MLVLASLVFGTRLDGDQWVGWCPSLRVFSCGDTEEEALAAVREAADLWLESCVERGTLEAALAELGFLPTESPLTHDVVRIDSRSYCRFPDYSREVLAQILQAYFDAARADDAEEPDEAESFHFQPDEQQELHA